MTTPIVTEAHALLNKYDWYTPFPMGVFGTLRAEQWNNYRMHVGKVKSHYRAFMPNFYAHGLSISYRAGCTAPFEVFHYDIGEWNKMIRGVDSLEGFYPPTNRESYSNYGYFRTLAWLHILPDDFQHELFPKGKANLSAMRDLQIPKAHWERYERLPCWVYSSRGQNALDAAKETVISG